MYKGQRITLINKAGVFTSVRGIVVGSGIKLLEDMYYSDSGNFVAAREGYTLWSNIPLDRMEEVVTSLLWEYKPYIEMEENE